VGQGYPTDAPKLAPAVKWVIERTGRKPRTVTADCGYGSNPSTTNCRRWAYAAWSSPQRQTRQRTPGRRAQARVRAHGKVAHRQRGAAQHSHTRTWIGPDTASWPTNLVNGQLTGEVIHSAATQRGSPDCPGQGRRLAAVPDRRPVRRCQRDRPPDRRQDEIGTRYGVTVDFESLADQAVTVRERDSMRQDRIGIDNLIAYLTERLSGC